MTDSPLSPDNKSEDFVVKHDEDCQPGPENVKQTTPEGYVAVDGCDRVDTGEEEAVAPLWVAAREMHAAGLNVVPVKMDGSKAPDLPRWIQYRQRRTRPQDHFMWFASGQLTGLGTIYGAVSGGVMMMEFEGRAVVEGVWDEVMDLMDANGLGQLWRRICEGWSEQSPSGGIHLHVRVVRGSVPGNTRLAARPLRDDELSGKQREVRRRSPSKQFPAVYIETRGEGGYAVRAPSHGPVHASGNPYVRVSGGPGSIPEVTREELERLFDVLRMADKMPQREVSAWDGRELTPVERPDGFVKPGEDFNQRADWAEILEPHGWTLDHVDGRKRHWTRPGKKAGTSAVSNHYGNDLLRVFTSSTEFEEKSYTKFTVYVLLNYGSLSRDAYNAATKEIGLRGYGTPLSFGTAGIPVPRAEDAPPIRWEGGERDRRTGSVETVTATRPTAGQIRDTAKVITADEAVTDTAADTAASGWAGIAEPEDFTEEIAGIEAPEIEGEAHFETVTPAPALSGAVEEMLEAPAPGDVDSEEPEPDQEAADGGQDEADEADEQQAAKNAERQFLRGEVYARKPDQMGAADLFTTGTNRRPAIRWNGEAERFLHYREGCWREDDKRHTELARQVDALGARVTEAVDNDVAHLREAIELAKQSGERGAKERIREAKEEIASKTAYYKPYRTAAGRSGILSFVSTSVEAIRTEELDAQPHLLNFTNGTYDARTGQMREHRMEDMLTHRVDHALDTALADKPLEEVAPLFAKLLQRSCYAPGEVSEETGQARVAAVKRSLGSIINGECSDKAILVYEGATDTGKTTVMEIVRAILGQQLATSAKPTLITKTRGDRHESEEYKLKGRRFALVNELTTQMTLDEGQVLRLVNPGGSSFTVRRLNQQQEDVNITWNIAVTTNELPRARVVPGVLGRLRIYQMSEVSVPREQRDTALPRKIIEQEAPAVLAHLVKWWREWYQAATEKGTGLIITEEMAGALVNFEENNESLRDQFRDEAVIEDADHLMKPQDVWTEYINWHQIQHPNERLEYGVNRKQFYEEILGWPGVEPVYKQNGYRPDGTPKKTLNGIKGIRVLTFTERRER